MVNNTNGASQQPGQTVFDFINQQNQKNSTAKTNTNDQSDMFMKLMVAQLKNQDPTSPAKTNEFMQQISSMTMVENMAKMNQTMESMSSSLLNSQAALQASSLVGKNVYVKTDSGMVKGNNTTVKGIAELPTATPNLRISVYDDKGSKVSEMDLGARQPGDHSFEWNSGELPEGKYRLVASAETPQGHKVVQSFLAYNVNSVTLGQNGVGMKVNTDAGAIASSDIKQIG